LGWTRGLLPESRSAAALIASDTKKNRKKWFIGCDRLLALDSVFIYYHCYYCHVLLYIYII